MFKHKTLQEKIKEKTAFPKSILLIDPGKPGGTIYGASTAIGLHVLCETADQSGWKTTVLNMSQTGSPHDALKHFILNERPSVIGITSTSSAHSQAIACARVAAETNPNLIIFKGGPHETFGAVFSHDQNTYPVDISFIGEADHSFPETLEALVRQGDFQSHLHGIQGICCRSADGLIIKTGDRPVKLQPTDFVLPSAAHIPLEQPFDLLREGPMIRVQGMRGCGYGCEFCAITGRARRVDPRTFVDYLESVIQTTHAKSIFFEDATFTLGEDHLFKHMQGWVEQFCELFKKALPEVIFGIQTRADSLNTIISRLLYAAGCRSVYIGVETLSSSSLKLINKGEEEVAQISGIKSAKEQGLKVTTSLICDLGSENDFINTLATLAGLKADEIFMEAEKIFPGTKLSKKREHEVLSFYDNNPGRNGSANIEDHFCMLVRDITLINRRYQLAEALLDDQYRMVSVGHWIRKSIKI